MADFKISRFRYTWKGNWNPATDYIRDDVVRYGGSSWVCIRQHSSDTFISDQSFISVGDTGISPAWVKMTDGYEWKTNWSVFTLYNAGDIVLNGGALYLCVVSHSSLQTIEESTDNWALYASQNNFREDWIPNTRYNIDDTVKYGAIVYRCQEAHTSSNLSNGLEEDEEKWIVVFSNIEFRGNWVTGQRYRENDIVKFGGTLFRCKQGHTPGSDSTLNFDLDEFWEVELLGNQPSGEWDSQTVYQIGDVVRHGGNLYYSLTNNYGSNPSSSIYQTEDRADPIDWLVLSKGINFRGNWNSTTQYKTGDVVKRGGNLYTALIDTEISADGSSLDYLDLTNWELLTDSIEFRSEWALNVEYAINELVVFGGNTYKCNFQHMSSTANFPGDNGEGIIYWDEFLIVDSSNVGMRQFGDLLTFDLSRTEVSDGSTFAPTPVVLSETSGQLLTINNENSVIYKDYGHLTRVRYVGVDGVDTEADPQQGISPFKPWRTIGYAAEKLNDGFAGTTTIRVAAGRYEEVLPIIVPARTAISGAELRTTTVVPNNPNYNVALDSASTIAVLTRINQIVDGVLTASSINKTLGNTLDPVIVYQRAFNLATQEFEETTTPVVVNQGTIDSVVSLIADIISYINFFINSSGENPVISGSNEQTENQSRLNAALVLDANQEFLQEEVISFMRLTFPNYNFDSDLCNRDIKKYIEAWIYDLRNPGNYKTILAARYYRNSVLGSKAEDMFYLRDATGLRNMTTAGLFGSLNPPNVFDLYRLPTGGSFVSLDPGWGPDDTSTWINTRSPYVQNVTTIGEGCVGQKIDGALHNGGNKSIVSNDFTQVLSDGVGAWVKNNGRAELVSVFTYYCHVGYLAEDGGIIRGTNGNNSYGRFGAVSDGVDPSETPKTATIFNRNNLPSASAFAGDFTDTIQLLEWNHAGENFTSAEAVFLGAGTGASVVFEDFRDDAVFQSKVLDANPPTTLIQNVGGGGYTRVQNNAQVHQTPNGDNTSITISSNDAASQEDYLGLRIIITGGPGTGQYGYITAYNVTTKVVSVAKESNGQPGWDHVIPGTPNVLPFTSSTAYRIEPRVIYSDPGFEATEVQIPLTNTWSDITYGETTVTFTGVSGGVGLGVVEEQDGLEPITATFNVLKIGRNYTVTINNPGAGYELGQVLTVLGTNLGGATPVNDLSIEITEISNDSTNSIISISSSGVGTSGNFVIIPASGLAGLYSPDGQTWSQTNLPSSGNWKKVAAGNNMFVAIRTGSAIAASSTNGINWTTRSLPASRNWSSVVYGNGKFVAVAGNQNSAAYSTNGTTWTATTMPTIGDSTINEWVDITYGKGKFVAIANSQNIAAYSEDGITWSGTIMDTISDSTQKDWVGIAYGNNRYVGISSQGDIAYSFNGNSWLSGGLMPAEAGSSAMTWKTIKYSQGLFFAICEAEGLGQTSFMATSQDGIVWTQREADSELAWSAIGFGNPYIDAFDSTVGKSTPMWVATGNNANLINNIRTGARALGRVETTSGVISSVKLWDPGSGYTENPVLTLIDPNNTSDAIFRNRIGDGVLTNPSWVERGIGYRTTTTRVTITGNGYADVIPVGKFITISALANYPGPGAQIIIGTNPTRYTVVTVTSVTENVGGNTFSAMLRLTPEIKVKDDIQHETPISIREQYSQVRITGHDFLDIGTGNFVETNYPEVYSTGIYTPAPEDEVIEEDGGRVFYTSTDQSGNFRTGELFAVEQATGIVTISADFFDLSGLTELRLGGIRVGGSGAIIREFSTDSLFTEDSNNVVPTQRAIRAFLSNRLSLGGSEVAVGAIIAGQISLGGPDNINNVLSLKIVVPVRADFDQLGSGISGSMLAQNMFYKSFNEQ